jgi:peptidoglycan/xylan/chitin deacetylase (PgdA/CDA1 family)
MKIVLTLAMLALAQVSFALTPPTVHTHAAPGTVALTFDDGPSLIFTPQILDILKKNNIKATFFVVGASAKKYPELIKRIQAEGHYVNDHTMTHPMLTKLAHDKWYFEMVEPANIVEKIVGKRPACLRYPFGASNSAIRSYIRAEGMNPVPMGFNSFDYNRPGVAKISSWVIANAHSGEVILMHDGYAAREQTVAALPTVIAGIRKKGLGFSQICATF